MLPVGEGRAHLGLLGDPVVCVHALDCYVADVNAWNASVFEKQALKRTKGPEGKTLLYCPSYTHINLLGYARSAHRFFADAVLVLAQEAQCRPVKAAVRLQAEKRG